jgi:CelD/BcsL family acetyltransferase involved in cellulose biosynthesis
LELPQAAENPLLAFDWHAAALATLHCGQPPQPFQVQRDGAVVALAPLVSVSRAGITRLEFSGAHVLHEPAGFLFRDAAALEQLCAALISLRRPLLLQRLQAEGPELPALRAAARGRGRLLELGAAAAPVVRIAGDWDSWSARLSSRRRQDYRRARRRLQERGAVQLQILSPTTDSVDAQLAELMQVESAGWKGARGSALLANAALGNFFRDLSRRLAARGTLRICFLRVDGRAIAAQLCVEHAQRWWVLKIGYDETWADYSPGVQLMWDVLRHAFGLKLRSVELLGTAEPWLGIWTDEQHACRTLVYYPYSPRGALAFGADALGSLARRLRPGQKSRAGT